MARADALRAALARPAPRRKAGPASFVPWRWALAGALAGALLVGVLWAPARWLAAAVAWGSAGQVQLADPRGSVWAGSARLLLTGGAGSRDRLALPGRVQWRLRPGWGGAHALLEAPCCTPQALALTLTPGWRGTTLAVADARSSWPATLLAGLGAPFNSLQPEGRLEIATRALTLRWLAGRLTMAGQAELTAHDVSSRLTTLKPMGSYRFTLNGGDAVTAQLDTLDGSALQLRGQGQWSGGRLRFSGVAEAAPGLEAQLANLLTLIGRRDGPRAILSIG